MRSLIAISLRLAGQNIETLQTELTLLQLQLDYISHAQIR